MAAEYLALIESVDASVASIHHLYGNEGLSLRDARRRMNQQTILETARFMNQVLDGKRPVYHLTEALTTSDFPLYFAAVLDRVLLDTYRQWVPTYQNYVKKRLLNDFRTANLFAIDGAESYLAAVPERTEYPMAQLADTRYTLNVQKYGRAIGMSWEAMVNDDLDALRDIPNRFRNGAIRSEERAATQLFVDASGPHASFYTSGNKNIVNTTNGASATNPPLSISALQDALIVLSKQVDVDGEPIVVDTVELVVPPALEVPAQNILHGTELWVTGQGGTTTQQLHTVNWMRDKVRVNVNPYIPVIASSANGNTSWFLFANPDVGRPALAFGFLRGHDTPELFMKTPNQQRIGGGSMDNEGDFESDTNWFKVRHTFGGTRIDPKMTVASNGSGS